MGQAGVYPGIVFTVTDDGVPGLQDQETITISVTSSHEGEGEGVPPEGEGEGLPPEGEGEGLLLEGEGETGCHSGDQNCDGRIDLEELLRVIQFFNTKGYHCAPSTEDGYDVGPGAETCRPHDSDYMPQNWLISLTELLRAVQFFNSGGYHYCPAENTEDGFCPAM